jgi:hypothetical protein
VYKKFPALQLKKSLPLEEQGVEGKLLLGSMALKIKAVRSVETWVTTYRTTQRNIPEEWRFQLEIVFYLFKISYKHSSYIFSCIDKCPTIQCVSLSLF